MELFCIMCYVLVENENWTADTNYLCEDDSVGESLKTELHEILGEPMKKVIDELRKNPKILQAVNDGFAKKIHIDIDPTPPKKTEQPASLDW